MFNKLCFFLIISMALGFYSCSEDTIKLTIEEKQLVDSLYLREVKVLRPVLDSLCSARKDSMTSAMADSLVQVREAEIEKIMNRK